MDTLAGIIGIVWNVAVLALLWRWRQRGAIFIVIAAYLISFYTADRLLPRVLVDAWTNFDAARSPALRPLFILPDLLLIYVLAVRVRGWPSRAALILLLALGVSTITGIVGGFSQPAVPPVSTLFWATVPLRAMAIVLLVDATVSRVGSRSATIQVVSAITLGAGLIAIEILGVVALRRAAELAGYDLASVWSGFDWVRPNLPGINNNIAASIIGFGAAGAVLMPRSTCWPRVVRGLIVVVSAVSLVLTEYRTGIIVLAVAFGVRVALEIFRRLPSRPLLLSAGAAALSGAVTCVVLLAASTLAVPRFADINPIGYVTQTINGTTAATPPAQESTRASPNATPSTDDPGETADTSTQSRSQILQAALKVWLRQPLAGPGLGTWEFARPTQPTFLQKAITPHSGYAWVLADLGLLGVAAFYLIPALLVAFRRPPVEIVVWLVLLAILELAVVGVAHSRYGAVYWAALAVGALAPWTVAERAETVATIRS